MVFFLFKKEFYIVRMIITKPYLLFWGIIPVMLLLNVFNGTETIDVNVHDTYFVIEMGFIYYFVSVILGLIGFGYWVTQKANRKLSSWLNAIHIVITFGALIALLIIPYVFNSKSQSDFPLYDNLHKQNVAITIVVVLMLLAQVLYVFNLVMALFREKVVS